jgi:2-polyprenyl-6-hydroxyphenyl methylase/3-demethylubiquinone-9 3-methyltransferase
MRDLTAVDTHFGFGENWKDFLSTVDEGSTLEAERGLTKLLPDGVRGKTFLDIGCGSGLHLLAAERLGAIAMGVDIDPNSVAAAKSLGCAATVCSVFDLPTTPFDIVYSWGVLHHTGAMWEGVEKAASLVKSGGTFVLALYRKTPLCTPWRLEKRVYRKLPALLQRALRMAYGAAHLLAVTATGKNPAAYLQNYRSRRGMSYWHDIHDWLGGYPYESARPADVVSTVEGLGFELEYSFVHPVKAYGLFGSGCDEFVFRRP